MTPSIIRVTLLALGLLLLPIAAGPPVCAPRTRSPASRPTRSSRRSASSGKRSTTRGRRGPARATAGREGPRGPLNAPKVLGRADAPVTLVEFTDLECPFCRSFHVGAFEKIKHDVHRQRQGPLRLRDFPLDFHPNARPAAVAVRCAGEQGKFWEMRHLVTVNAATLGREKYDGARHGPGPGRRQVSASASTPTGTRPTSTATWPRAMKLGVNGTPSFFVGKTAPDAHRGAADRRRPALPGRSKRRSRPCSASADGGRLGEGVRLIPHDPT